MKKKSLFLLLLTISATLSACAGNANTVSEKNSEILPSISAINPDHETSNIISSTFESETNETVYAEPEETVATETVESEALNEIEQLSEEEKQQRKATQWALASERAFLYQNPCSVDNTQDIVQKDLEILANNTYDFSHTKICFIGDSITEGITATETTEGKYISYVNYANESLGFERTLNHGLGGRMFGTYGGEDYSIIHNFDTLVNMDSDILVIFAGVNDYLSNVESKRFGNPDDTVSTAGYCGELRSFMKKLQLYCSGKEIFFVLTYPISADVNPDYSDISEDLSLADYIEVERNLAEEFGFHTIDFFTTNILDCTIPEVNSAYMYDSVHPNDFGYCVLGRHIAAELSLYFSQNQ